LTYKGFLIFVKEGWALSNSLGLPSISSSLCLGPTGFPPSEPKIELGSAEGACAEARETSDTEVS